LRFKLFARVEKSVAVVILNWNGLAHLQRFLPGVVAHSPEADIVVADNGSSDQSLAWLREHWPQVPLIDLGQNYGFSEGYNLALAQLPHPLHLLLNSDVEVTPGWLAPLLAFMDQHHGCAALQPKLRAVNQPSHFEYAGAGGGYIDWWGYPYCRGRIFNVLEADLGQYDQPVRVHWASGAAMLVRSAVYRQLGGLDKAFFAHMEEIDLCWRMRNAGHEVWCVPASTVYHLGGGTLHKSNPAKTYLNFRNGLKLLYKNLPTGQLLPIIFGRLCLDGLAGLQLMLQGKGRDTWAIVRAHFAFYRAMPYYWRKRKALAPLVDFKRGRRSRFSIVWQHFANKVQTFSALPADKICP
jgi:GT2 family glycosyltransferase